MRGSPTPRLSTNLLRCLVNTRTATLPRPRRQGAGMATGKKTTARDTAERRAHVAAALAESERKQRRGKLIFRSVLAALITASVGGVAVVVVHSQNAGKIAGVVSYSNLSR